jgi:hypothetical protein
VEDLTLFVIGMALAIVRRCNQIYTDAAKFLNHHIPDPLAKQGHVIR